jgi:hypothetical protein
MTTTSRPGGKLKKIGITMAGGGRLLLFLAIVGVCLIMLVDKNSYFVGGSSPHFRLLTPH